ncbi:MAG: DUF1127 domain-containing protein [Gammaproteobacteria bacterium]|nr:DUF1127 domain-containing protein [Gammaproteobacteria bacterium]
MQQTALTMDSDVAARVPRWMAMGQGRRIVQLLACWLERYRQRRALARLDEHLLRDIGVTADQAAVEVAKPFWRG